MFEALKRLFSHVLVYGLGNIVARAVTFFLAPLLTNYVNPEEFGKLGLVQTFIALAQVFLVCGMGSAVVRYSVREKYPPGQVLGGGLLWIILLSGASLSALYAAFPWVAPSIGVSSHRAYLYMLAILVLDSLSVPGYSFLQGAQRPLAYASFRIAQVTVHFGGTFYLIVFKHQRTLEAVLLANAAASLFQFVLFTPLYLRNARRPAGSELLKRMIKFGLPYVPNVLFVVAVDLIDRFIVARMLGLTVVGYYSAAVKLAMIMYLMVYAFQAAWPPFFLSRANDPGSPRLFARVMTYYVLSACGLFLFMGLFYRNIANLGVGGFTLVGKNFQSGLSVIPWILVAYIFCGIYINLGASFHFREKTKFFPLFSLAGVLVNVGANLLLIPRMGLPGAGLATLLSYVVMAAMAFPVSRKLFRVDYEWRRMGTIALVTALLFALGGAFDRTAFKAAAFLGFLPALWVLRAVAPEERARIKAFFAR